LFILALYVHFLTILLELDDVGAVVHQILVEVFHVGLVVVVLVVVGFGLGLTTGILKSGCALSINPGMLLAFSSERFMKISCPS
jgi:hypothetical protein